jgi:DDE superfamily endonuclease
MASRLYRSTRSLYTHVSWILKHLGITEAFSPTGFSLVALYVSGLILLDVRQTQTRVSRFLPGRCHDAINRLLRVMPFSSRALMALVVRWVRGLGIEGYLCLDDVIVEKAFAKKLPWAGWTYSWAKGRKLYGLHLVVFSWCSHDGRFRIPVAFRLWRPKRACAKGRYLTKLKLAEQMLKELVSAKLSFDYLAFDTHYTAGWFTRVIGRLGQVWVGTLHPRTIVVFGGRRQQVNQLAKRLRLKWRKHLGLRAVAVQLYAPNYGVVRLVVTKNRHGNYQYIATNALSADLTSLVIRKRSRWSIETVFRDTKQYAALSACQCWVDQAMVRHVSLVLLTFIVLQLMRLDHQESVAAVKERWQLAVQQNGQLPPIPLRACPTHLRATA